MAKPENKKNQRELHAKALEGIVNANGFFTAAVFVGISGTVAPSPSVPRQCVPGADIVENLFLFEVLSFSFYLVSSLIAQGMKLAIDGLEAVDRNNDTYQYKESADEAQSQSPPPAPLAKKKLWWFRKMMMLSVALSILGSILLMLAMMNVIQLKLGLLSCGGTAAVIAVLVLTLLGAAGLFVYIGGVVYSLSVY